MEEGTRKRGTKRGKQAVTCEECYFRCNLLCALDLPEPCPTFRPNTPEGLRPPRQLALVMRQERLPRRLVPFRQPT